MKKGEFGKKEIFGSVLVLLTAIVSGFSIIINKYFVATIDPLVFTAVRAFFIGIIFLIISFYFTKKTKGKKFKRASWGSLISIGIIGGGLAFWLFFVGLNMTSGGRAAFLHKTLPIYAAIFGFIFLKEKLSRKYLISIGVMLAGLILMELSSLSFEMRVGDFLVLGATILWAVENTISKRIMLDKESNWVVTFSRMFFGSIVLFAVIGLLDKTGLLFSLNSAQLIKIVVSGLLLFAYVLTWYWGLKYINLSKAATILLLAPVISLFLGTTWLGESIGVLQIVGSVLILSGAYFVLGEKSKKRTK